MDMQADLLRSNKKRISVFRVTGLKILGRVGTYIFLFFFSGKKIYNFMHFERHPKHRCFFLFGPICFLHATKSGFLAKRPITYMYLICV